MVGAEDLGLGPSCKSSKYKVVVYDTETNGENEQRVIELAAYAVESGQKFTTLINSDCEVCRAPMHVTGNNCVHSGCTNDRARMICRPHHCRV